MPAEEIRPGLWKSGADRFPADSQVEADQIAETVTRIQAEREPATQMIAERLVLREGFIPAPRDIGDGVETVGYGHNLNARPWTNSQRAYLRLDQGRDLSNELMTQEEGQAILKSDIQIDMDAVKTAWPGMWRQLSPVRRTSLGELAHIVTDVGQFVKMGAAITTAIANNDYAPELFQRAAIEMSDSQVGRGIASNGVSMPGNVRRINELALMLAGDQPVTIQDQDPMASVPLFQQGATQ